jgi:hypothetical protein
MSRRFFFKIFLVAIVAVLSLLVLPGVLFAQGRSDQGLERAIEVQEKHTPQLMAIPGVVGTAVGLDQDSRAVVKVFTARGGVPGIPGRLEDVRVQPVVTGEFYALPKPESPGGGKGSHGGGGHGGTSVDPTARFDRPVPIGISTGHPAITAGTIGCRVTDGTNVYALSNNHVYANENQANIGDAVIQPGTYDGGSSHADDIGTLYDFEPIDFYDYENPPSIIPTNTIDAAIALSSTDLLGKATPSDGYGTAKSDPVAASLNQSVKKYGRTTGLTKGKVYALNATVDVGYDHGVARFVGQIVITPGGFSAGGDSGSLIVVDDKKGKNVGPNDLKPVGLLFAGSSLYTIANPIDEVLSRFGVTIDGE